MYMACQVSYKTIKVYIAGIRLEHLERGLEDPTKDELLQLLCTGIKRSQGAQTCTRLPVTIVVLQILKSQLQLDSTFSPLEKRLLWAAFTMAFYRFLRASEFATQSLKWQHVQRTGKAYTIFIEQSKTNPFCCGHSITIYASGTLTWPVRASSPPTSRQCTHLQRQQILSIKPQATHTYNTSSSAEHII